MQENKNTPNNPNSRPPQRVWSDVSRPARPVRSFDVRPARPGPARPIQVQQSQQAPQPQPMPPPPPPVHTDSQRIQVQTSPGPQYQPQPTPVQPPPQLRPQQPPTVQMPPQPVQPPTQPQPMQMQPRPRQASNQMAPARPMVPTRPQPIYPPIPQEMQTQPDALDDVNQADLSRVNVEERAVRERHNLPKGVFAIIAVSLIGLAIGIIDKSQNNLLFTIILGLDLIIAVSMIFLRKNFVLKTAMGLAILTATASAALLLSYRGLTDSTVKAEAMFIEEAKKLQNQSPTKQLTKEQQAHLDAMQFKLEAQQAGVGKNGLIVYGKFGFAILAFAGVAFYLSRPKVKEAYQKSD